MKFLDANIILRYLTNDIPSESLKCEILFRDVSEGRVKLFTNALVIAEVIWVLFSEYHFVKLRVIDGVRKILNSPNIHLDDKGRILSALEIFEMHNLDFIDSYNATMMKDMGIDTIYSYDKHYDLVKEIKRLKP